MPRDKLQSLLGVPVPAPELKELEKEEAVEAAAEEGRTKISANQVRFGVLNSGGCPLKRTPK